MLQIPKLGAKFKHQAQVQRISNSDEKDQELLRSVVSSKRQAGGHAQLGAQASQWPQSASPAEGVNTCCCTVPSMNRALGCLTECGHNLTAKWPTDHRILKQESKH